MTTSELRRLLPVWQRRLRLQDWDIHVSLAPEHLVGGDARNQFNRQLKTAKISITTEDTWNAEGHLPQPYDAEQALVHELVHLHFAGVDTGIPAGSMEATQLETAIDQIAWALVRGYRG